MLRQAPDREHTVGTAAGSRDRQPRTFARAWLGRRHGLSRVAGRHGRRWHAERAGVALRRRSPASGIPVSSSRCGWRGPRRPGRSNWLPDDERAELQLRVPGPGTLDDLERRYNAEAVERLHGTASGCRETERPAAHREAKKRLREEFGGRAAGPAPPRDLPLHGYARPERRRGEAPRWLAVFSAPARRLRPGAAKRSRRRLGLPGHPSARAALAGGSGELLPTVRPERFARS
ncbi:MAG: hypothetical protein KatS3mg076_0077 [Candidatus Binatia bacterium]|nr:MAG: hypothetical protein KatS3mg076_0077 [Candidatus Binatia bacterium]